MGSIAAQHLPFILVPVVISLLFMYVFNRRIYAADEGTPRMRELAGIIRKSAYRFLKTEYMYLGIFVVVLAVILFALPVALNLEDVGMSVGVSFVIGAISSGAAGLIGMNKALIANVRTASAARKNLNDALKISFSAGSMVGLALVTIGVVGLLIILFLFPNNIHALIGYSFGVAAIALVARVGGGIFTKAADVGADLVGKVEAGIPEDDPRNPAVIADNVGDNVGDTAGMGADLFDSLIVNTVAAMAIGLIAQATTSISGTVANAAFIFPLLVVSAGLIGSIVGTYAARTKSDNPSAALTNAFLVTCAVMLALTYVFNNIYFKDNIVFYCCVIGVLAGILVGKITEYYTSHKFKHVQQIVHSSSLGPAGNIIHGLSVGKRSTFTIVIVLLIAIFTSFQLGGLYGVAMAGVGMLALAPIIMAIDVFGPIVDNAGGIAEMSKLDKKVRQRTDALDSAGNTTAAIGKGFAIGSAALAALALLTLFAHDSHILESGINLLDHKVMIGLFFGALIPYRFAADVLVAVGSAASKIADEVRRQFKSIKGIMEGKRQPDYDRCIDIATKAALKEMIFPSLLVICAPIAVGLVLGVEALGGALAGTLVSGVLLGVKQSNSGGAWDNAKKLVETGHKGGKGSDTHKATVVGDTVGDPYKDSAGPSLNIVIKLSILVATVLVIFF